MELSGVPQVVPHLEAPRSSMGASSRLSQGAQRCSGKRLATIAGMISRCRPY